MHEVPSIIIGTQCHDRDDVGMRLEELGTSVYLPGPRENENFVSDFKRTIEQFFADSGRLIQEKKKNLATLNREVERTVNNFNFESVLQKAAGRSAIETGRVRVAA